MPRHPSSSDGSTVSNKRLVLLQIDGLSRYQFERATRAGRMPFLRKLLKRQRHQLKTFYPGQPSCTPAVQAELFFGVPAATPAFSFYDVENKQDVRMYDAEWAIRIAKESSQHATGLLEGGASYANIYTGGAKRAKYCGELNTFSHWTQELSLPRLLGLAIKKPITALRVIALLVAELWIALYDAIKGIYDRGEFFKELMFVPARIGVSIALREAIRGEVLDDLRDGLPIIHANFFGYDEAAHRRGPQSRFAHWSLGGIDRVIKDIYLRAVKNGYDVIIFSDHGQESSKPYHEEAGCSLHDTTRRLFCSGSDLEVKAEDGFSAFMERSKQMAKEVFEDEAEPEESKRWIHVHAMGPVAHVYVDTGLTESQKAVWARRYCLEGDVPIALYRDELEDPVCRIGENTGSLALLQEALVKRGHQFPEQTVRDLETVLASRYTGDLMLLGWRSSGKPITFADERGSHAGPGAEEMRGFVMLPQSLQWSHESLRPNDLRNIALEALGRENEREEHGVYAEPLPRKNVPLRVATYNVHGGVGVDRKRDMRRLAAVVKEMEPDVVCFQEAFECQDQGLLSLRKCLTDHWESECHFHFLCLHQRGGIRYGLATASKRPFRLRKAEAFNVAAPQLARREPRGAVWIELDDEDQNRIQIVNTHFGLNAYERSVQTDILLSQDWLGSCPESDRIVLCGDFNAGPNSPAYRAFASRFADAQLIANQGKASPSFLSWAPLRRIDHIFATSNLSIPAAGVFRTSNARRASDHLPVFADMKPLAL